MNEIDMQRSRPMIVGNIPKLPVKYAAWILPLFLSCLMSGIISLINLLRNLGWIEGFMQIWLSSWMISWAFAFPIVLIILPFVRRLTGLVVDIPPINPQ